ncbi:unnamed protein product [Alopecurus aequalis]
MDMSSTSSSSSTSPHEQGTARPKRPAGRTKFKETRHAVYRGVRRRGNAGRWVCEGNINFADSAWLLAMPPALSDLAHVRRAALAAVADFLRREDATVPTHEAASNASAPSYAENAGWQPYADGTCEVPAGLGSDMFEMDMSGEMDLDTYYAALAEGLLLEPPSPQSTSACWDTGDGGADPDLWSY